MKVNQQIRDLLARKLVLYPLILYLCNKPAFNELSYRIALQTILFKIHHEDSDVWDIYDK